MLEIKDDVIVFDGDHAGMDKVFPADGVIRIKRAPEKLKSDSPE